MKAFQVLKTLLPACALAALAPLAQAQSGYTLTCSDTSGNVVFAVPVTSLYSELPSTLGFMLSIGTTLAEYDSLINAEFTTANSFYCALSPATPESLSFYGASISNLTLSADSATPVVTAIMSFTGLGYGDAKGQGNAKSPKTSAEEQHKALMEFMSHIPKSSTTMSSVAAQKQ